MPSTNRCNATSVRLASLACGVAAVMQAPYLPTTVEGMGISARPDQAELDSYNLANQTVQSNDSDEQYMKISLKPSTPAPQGLQATSLAGLVEATQRQLCR